MSGRISRAQRDALDRQDAPFVKAPLVGGNPNSIAAHLRHMTKLLRSARAPSPCADAISHINTVFERSVPSSARAMLACRKGCAYCCSQSVLVYAPEAFFIAAQLRDRPDTALAIQEATQKLNGRSPDAPDISWIRCPLLLDGSCSVYAARPLSCHAYVSLNVSDCMTTLLQPGGPNVTSPPVFNSLRDACRMILLAALRLNDLPDTAYELNAAVNIVLKTDDAERRWLQGENIFADLAICSPTPKAVDEKISQMVAAISQTL